MLAGPGGQDANRHVPMIGRGDHDRINVLARQQLAKISIGLTLAGRGHTIAIRFVAIRRRHTLELRQTLGVSKDIPSAATYPNVPDRDPFTGCRLVLQT